MYEATSVIQGRSHAGDILELDRAARVEQLGLVNAGSDALDEVVRRAAQIMETSVAAVTVLLGEDQFLIARTGLHEMVSERASSFCTHVTAARAPLTVSDATRHPDFAWNPIVGFGARSIRAYSGVPLTTADGTVVAVLCVADAEPRNFTTAQCAALRRLGVVANAILVDASARCPDQDLDPPSDHVPCEDGPVSDELPRWIDAHVPHAVALAVEARRRTSARWFARLTRACRLPHTPAM